MSGDLGAPAHALLAAACFAGSQVMIRRGLVRTSLVAGVLISLASAFVGTGLFVALDPPGSVHPRAVALFALAGLAAPGVSRWASAAGIQRLGPSVAVPITQGMRPLLAVTAAVLLLGETLSAAKVTGLIAIVVGGWQLSRKRSATSPSASVAPAGEIAGPTISDSEEAFSPTRSESDVPPALPRERRRVLRPGVGFPLAAACSYAASDVVMKEGLAYMDAPPFGAFVGMATAVAIWILVFALVPAVRKNVSIARDAWWLVFSGFFIGIAVINLTIALSLGDVTVVSPLLASQPLAVFVLSRLLLKRLEDLHPSTLVAGISVVVGSVILSL